MANSEIRIQVDDSELVDAIKRANRLMGVYKRLDEWRQANHWRSRVVCFLCGLLAGGSIVTGLAVLL